MIPPTTVKVGPHIYKIARLSKSKMPKVDGDQLSGCCDFDGLQISLEKSLPVSRSKECLLHEILHACNLLGGTSFKTMEEEDFVDKLSPHLLQVLQQNPDLVEYLIK